MDQTAAVLAGRGVKMIRGMGYKPRTSPYDFQGMGEEGLKIARQVANKYNMMVISEVLDMSLIPMMDEYVDAFWVGARNMQNSYLLRALGKQKKPVLLKRSFGATLKEFIYAAEYIMASGNEQVILMERGIRAFSQWTRNTLDISAVPLLKKETHLPVFVDISHSGRPARHRQSAGPSSAGQRRRWLDGGSASQSRCRHVRCQTAAGSRSIQRADGRCRVDFDALQAAGLTAKPRSFYK